jgi:hypothetical protein
MGKYEDSAVEGLQGLYLFRDSAQPQRNGVMGWRRPEFIGKCLAATAFEENEVEQAAGNVL